MEKAIKAKPFLNKRDIFIRDLIQSSPKNQNISINKVMERFNNIAESKHLSKLKKSNIHKIMRNILKLHFKKKVIKNKKLITPNYIKFSCFFIKVISGALNLELKFIFIDESGFCLLNNNFKTWASKDEEIYFGNGKNDKVNLLLGVSNEKIFHFKLNKNNTTSLIFMKELKKKMNEEEKKIM